MKNRTKIIKINDNAKYKLRSDSFDRFVNSSKKTDLNFNRNNAIDLIIYDNKGNSYNSLKKIEYYQETKYFVYCKRYFKKKKRR